MGLETGTQIGDLIDTNPVTATDPVSEGSDHLRLVKTCVQGSLGKMAELLAFVDNNVPLRMANAALDGYLDMIKVNVSDQVQIGGSDTINVIVRGGTAGSVARIQGGGISANLQFVDANTSSNTSVAVNSLGDDLVLRSGSIDTAVLQGPVFLANQRLHFVAPTIEAIDADNAVQGGDYQITSGAANLPFAASFLTHTIPVGPTSWGQLAMNLTGGALGQIFFRTLNSGAGGAWNQIAIVASDLAGGGTTGASIDNNGRIIRT